MNWPVHGIQRSWVKGHFMQSYAIFRQVGRIDIMQLLYVRFKNLSKQYHYLPHKSF